MSAHLAHAMPYGTKLLAEGGALYIHLDWRMASLVRVLLDEIFGPDRPNIRRVIIHSAAGFIGHFSGHAGAAARGLAGRTTEAVTASVPTVWVSSKDASTSSAR